MIFSLDYLHKKVLPILKFFTHTKRYRAMFKSEAKCDMRSFSRWWTLRDFETKFLCKQFGYSSCDDYYRDACVDVKIHRIRTPTLFLHSRDDMFAPAKSLPLENIRTNPLTAMVLTTYGGHIAWCEGWRKPLACNYTCRILTDYLTHVVLNSPDFSDMRVNIDY